MVGLRTYVQPGVPKVLAALTKLALVPATLPTWMPSQLEISYAGSLS